MNLKSLFLQRPVICRCRKPADEAAVDNGKGNSASTVQLPFADCRFFVPLYVILGEINPPRPEVFARLAALWAPAGSIEHYVSLLLPFEGRS
jgi:hypothetical protein